MFSEEDSSDSEDLPLPLSGKRVAPLRPSTKDNIQRTGSGSCLKKSKSIAFDLYCDEEVFHSDSSLKTPP
jgi:hypothetical protein